MQNNFANTIKRKYIMQDKIEKTKSSSPKTLILPCSDNPFAKEGSPYQGVGEYAGGG